MRYSQEALKLGTKDALLFFHAGMIHDKLGNRPEARAFLEHGLALNPYFSVLYRDQAFGTLDKLRTDSRETALNPPLVTGE